MDAKCGRKGCSYRSTHYLVAKVWPLGYPKTSVPMTSIIGLGFCKKHARDEAEEKRIIGDEYWELVDAMTRSRGVVPVDRASLELQAVRGDPANAIDAARRRQMQ